MVYFNDISNILFFDIETVSGEANYEQINDDFKALWQLKSRQILRLPKTEELPIEEISALYPERAGIFAEFGKIVCISVGIIHRTEDKQLHLRLKSFADDDEAKLLKDFANLLDKYYGDTNRFYLCGHNIKEFDVPYTCRRLIANHLPLPNMLNVAGKKPWETKYLLDTLELWKFGDYKNYTSLKLLAAVLGFPSPKDDIDGSEVGRVYWEEQDLKRIAVYCEKDVLATVQLFLRLNLLPLLKEEQVTFVS